MNIMHDKTVKFITQLRHATRGERRRPNTAKYPKQAYCNHKSCLNSAVSMFHYCIEKNESHLET